MLAPLLYSVGEPDQIPVINRLLLDLPPPDEGRPSDRHASNGAIDGNSCNYLDYTGRAEILSKKTWIFPMSHRYAVIVAARFQFRRAELRKEPGGTRNPAAHAARLALEIRRNTNYLPKG